MKNKNKSKIRLKPEQINQDKKELTKQIDKGGKK